MSMSSVIICPLKVHQTQEILNGFDLCLLRSSLKSRLTHPDDITEFKQTLEGFKRVRSSFSFHLLVPFLQPMLSLLQQLPDSHGGA